MNKLRQFVEDDLNVTKKIELVESLQHTFVFEVDKAQGD